MPRYRIQDESGRTLVLEGDAPPTEEELEGLFGPKDPSAGIDYEKVSANFKGSPEYLKAQAGGRSYMQADPEGMAQAAVDILGDASKAAEIASKGIHYAMQPFEEVGAMLGNTMQGSQPATWRNPSPAVPGQGLIPMPLEGAVGIGPSLQRTASSFTTPGNILAMPLIPESQLVKGAFTAGAAATLPPAIKALYESRTPDEALGALTDIGTGSLMAGFIGKGLGKEAVHGDVSGVDSGGESGRLASYGRTSEAGLSGRAGGRGGVDMRLAATARGLSEALRKGDTGDLQYVLASSGVGPEELGGLYSFLSEEEQSALEAIGKDSLRRRDFLQAANEAIAVFNSEKEAGSNPNRVSGNEDASHSGQKVGNSEGGIGPEAESAERIASAEQARPLTPEEYEALPIRQLPLRKARPLTLTTDELGLIEGGRSDLDVPVDVVQEPESKTEPGAANRRIEGQFMGINRAKGTIEVYPDEFRAWLEEVPAEKRAQAVKSRLAEERIHLATDDAAANAFWSNLSGLEKKINERRYLGATKRAGVSDTYMGHEALRFRLQQLSDMTPSELAETAGREHWTLKGLTLAETAIRGVRETLTRTLGSDASKVGLKDSLEHLNRIQRNLTFAKMVVSGTSPAAVRRQPVTIERPDGSTYEAEFNGYYDLRPYGGKLTPSIGRTIEGSMQSHGELNSGEKIVSEVPSFEEWSKAQESPGAIRRGGLSKAAEERIRLAQELTKAKLEAEAEAAGERVERPQLVQPVAEHRVGAEESGALPRLAPKDIDAKAKSYLESQISPKPLTEGQRESTEAPRPKYDRASFDKFAEWGKNNLPGIRPEQLRDIWIDSVWNHIINASGDRLAEWRKALRLEGSFGASKIAEPPTTEAFKLAAEPVKERGQAVLSRTQRSERGYAESQQRYRQKVASAVARKLISESVKDRASLTREAIDTEDIAFGNAKAKHGAYKEISPNEAKRPELLNDILRDQARATLADPESASRRLVALVNKSNGKVELVSTYNDAGTQRVTDPAGPRIKGKFSRDLNPTLLKQYEPVASVLLKDPVKGFRQTFESLSNFKEQIGKEAAERSAVGEFPEEYIHPEQDFGPVEGTEGLKGEGGIVHGPHSEEGRALLGIGKGSLDVPIRMTDNEARGIVGHVIGESGTFDSADDVRNSLIALTDKAANKKLNAADRLAISAYRKAFKSMEEKFPHADRENLIDAMADRIYENHKQAQSLEGFVKATMAEFPAKGSPITESESPAAVRRKLPKRLGEWVTNAIKNTGSLYDSWMVDRIARLGGEKSKVAAEGFKLIIDRQKELYGSLTGTLDKARVAAGGSKELPGVGQVPSPEGIKAATWLHGLDKVTPFAGTSRTVGAIENTRQVPAFAQKVVDLARDSNIESGRMVQSVTPGFQATGKFQRNPTALGYDAVRQGNGELLRKWIAGTARANKAPLALVQGMFREWKEALDKPGVEPAVIDKINQDFARKLPNVITHVRANGGWQEVVHSNLFGYLENAAQRASHIRAFREHFPNDASGRQLFRSVVDGLRSELGPDGQADLDGLVRTLQGHPTDNYSNMGALSPTEPLGNAFRTLNNTVGNLMAKMVLTGQMLTQPGELIAGSTPAFLGAKNYLRGLARLKQLYPELEQAGAVNRVMYDFSFDPNSPVRSAFRLAGNALSKGFAEQLVNELQEAGAAATARVVSERIQNKQLTEWEQRMLPETLRSMGFTTPEVHLAMQGDAQTLGQFERMAAAFLTSGNKAIAEGSRLGANRLMNSIFRFQMYPMMKMNQFRQVAGRFADVWKDGTPAKERRAATEQMARFVVGNTLQGAVTVALTTLGFSGMSGLKIRAQEAKDEPMKFLTESFLSSLSGPLYLAWRGARDKGLLGVGEQATRMVFPYTATRELIDMAGGHGQYKDASTFDRIGKFLANKTPGTKAIGTGLAIFGLGSESRDLDTAMSAFYRWRRQELGFSEQEDFLKEDDRKAFRTSMRKVTEALKEGDREKFNQAFLDATMEHPNGEQGVAGSLRARRLLKGPDGKPLTLEQMDSLRNRIGDEAVDRLQYFDSMLEAAANGEELLLH